jgi:hypothetical protein
MIADSAGAKLSADLGMDLGMKRRGALRSAKIGPCATLLRGDIV